MKRAGKPKSASQNGVFRVYRRAHRRYVLVRRTALLHSGGGSEVCLVRNISAGGMMGRTFSKTSLGSEVQLELRSDELIGGSVLWVQDWNFGVQFHEPIDVEALLGCRWVTEVGQRLRRPRVQVKCPAKLRVGTRPMQATVVDISEGGAKIETRTALTPYDRLIITIPDLPPLTAEVRWSEALIAGIEFEESLPFDVLADWVGERSVQ